MTDSPQQDFDAQLRGMVSSALDSLSKGVIRGFDITRLGGSGPEIFPVLMELLQGEEAKSLDRARAMAQVQVRLLALLEHYQRFEDFPCFVTKHQIEEYCEWIRTREYGSGLDWTKPSSTRSLL